MVKIKRVYEPAEPSDGVRILVDGLWPRGVSRPKAALTEWLKEIAPSNELRVWFGHRPERWEQFRARYRRELREGPASEALARLRAIARRRRVTLLYGARDVARNNAVVIAGLLGKR